MAADGAGKQPGEQGREPAAREPDHPGRPRNDLRPLRRAARDRRAGDDGLRQPARDRQPESRRERGRADARRRSERALSAAHRPHEGFRLRRTPGRPAEGSRAEEAPPGGPRLLPGGAALLPVRVDRVAAGRFRRDRQPRARRHGARARRHALGPPGAGDRDQGSLRTRRRRAQLGVRARRARRVPDDRPHDPDRRRVRAAHCRRPVARQAGDRDRPRPAHRRRAGDGDRARLRRQRLPERPALPAAELAGDGRVRARLDLQARHRGGGAVRAARLGDDRLHAAVLDPGLRQGDPRRRVAPYGDDDRRSDPVSLLERRRRHARAPRRRDAPLELDLALRLRARDGHRLPGRARASSCRATSGTARRSPRSRSGRASR